MNLTKHYQNAWDKKVDEGSRYTQPVDISQKQLKQDENVAKRDGLTLKTVLVDMSDLSDFKDEYFDIVINAVSNLFVKDVKPVWNEVSRVFKNKGILIAGFTNPLLWIFDDNKERKVS